MAEKSKANGASAGMMTLGAEAWGPMVAGAVKWNGRMYEGWAMLGSEWLDFANRRLKEDMKLPQRLCACGTPEEVRDTYAAFWHQTIDDYRKELAVLAKLTSGLLNNTLAATQSHIEEAARELRQPLAAAA